MGLSKSKEELIVGLLVGLSSVLNEHSNELPPDVTEAKNNIINALKVAQNTNSTEIDIEKLKANLISLRAGITQSKERISEKNLRSDMSEGVLNNHESYGERYSSVLETIKAYADEVFRAILTSVGSDLGGALVDSIVGRKGYIVSTDEEKYTFATADLNLTRSGARELGLRIKDYIDRVKQYNMNTLQRWFVKYDIGNNFYTQFLDLLSYYTMEVELPFPEISSGVIDVGTYIRDVMSIENKPFRLNILVDLKMHTVGVFNRLMQASGDSNSAMLGYKDDYKIKSISIEIEDNSLSGVAFLRFTDCIIREVSNITLRHEYADFRMIEVEIEYDKVDMRYGVSKESSKLDNTDAFNDTESREKEYYKQNNIN